LLLVAPLPPVPPAPAICRFTALATCLREGYVESPTRSAEEVSVAS
jgi:hypothetical protein